MISIYQIKTRANQNTARPNQKLHCNINGVAMVLLIGFGCLCLTLSTRQEFLEKQDIDNKEAMDFIEQRQHATAASSGSGSGSGGAPPRAQALPKNIDVADLEAYKPPSTTFWDDPVNNRIRVFWGPRRKSTSGNYQLTSKSAACKHVLEFAWTNHNKKTGEPIPYKF